MARPSNRFSLKILMAFIASVAVGLGLVRNGSLLAERVTQAILPIILLFALVGAIVKQDRAGWVGFAVFGWSYALLAFAVPLDARDDRRHNTASDLIDVLVTTMHPETGPPPTVPVFNPQFMSRIGDPSHIIWAGTGPGSRSDLRDLLSPAEVTTLDAYIAQVNSHQSQLILRQERWEKSYIIGHAFFCLVFALFGAAIGQFLSDRAGPSHPFPVAPSSSPTA